MNLNENERLQEIFIFIGDRLAPVNKAWWYLLAIVCILTIPAYYITKSVFVTVLVGTYSGPAIIDTAAILEPLTVLDKKIFTLPNQTYTGFIKIKNLNLEWGSAQQVYKVEFKTFGGTVLETYTRSTFILPASEKIIALPRFSASQQPDEIVVTLDETHFIRKPEVALNFEIERRDLKNHPTGTVVSSAFVNMTPFTIKEVGLPALVYNSRNEIVGANFTYINDVRSNETRTFQYTWPEQIPGAVRAEINPEINIFNRNILTPEADKPTTDSADRPK